MQHVRSLYTYRDRYRHYTRLHFLFPKSRFRRGFSLWSQLLSIHLSSLLRPPTISGFGGGRPGRTKADWRLHPKFSSSIVKQGCGPGAAHPAFSSLIVKIALHNIFLYVSYVTYNK